jgi:hypothetical protein
VAGKELSDFNSRNTPCKFDFHKHHNQIVRIVGVAVAPHNSLGAVVEAAWWRRQRLRQLQRQVRRQQQPRQLRRP